MSEPMYRVWMQEGVPPKTCYTERPGRWVGETSWPSPRIDHQRYFLTGGGGLQRHASSVSQRKICSPLWVGLAAGEVGRYGDEAEWATDQREDDAGSLVFVSEPLTQKVEILGAPLVRISFSSDKAQALVCVRLNDVAPDGKSTRVTVGLLNLTHRDSHEFPAALEPGKIYETTVELDDIAHAFAPGHRIAVSISTTYWPIAWPSPELATLTLSCGESWLMLPVRPPLSTDVNLRAFDEPEAAPQTPIVNHDIVPTMVRRVTRDLLSGKMTVDFPRWTYKKEMPDIGQTQTSRAGAQYEINDGDPLSAVCLTDYFVEMQRSDTTITHHSTGRLSCDATHFIVDMTLDVGENGTSIFKREWHERIPRDYV